MLLVTSTIPEHIADLSITMQDMDKESILMLSGKSPFDGLLDSVANSLETQSYILDGEIVAIAGINKLTLLSPWACPWLICSDKAHKSPRQFMSITKRWVEEKLEENKWLSNVVYAKHKKSIRWLEWLGFTLYPAKPMGPYGALFMRNELKWANKQ